MCVSIIVNKHQVDSSKPFVVFADSVHNDVIVFPPENVNGEDRILLVKLVDLFQWCWKLSAFPVKTVAYWVFTRSFGVIFNREQRRSQGPFQTLIVSVFSLFFTLMMIAFLFVKFLGRGIYVLPLKGWYRATLT